MCTSAGAALQQLKNDYQGQNVLFLEQDVDDPVGNRRDRWFLGHGNPGTVYLPLVMVDSGHRVSSGEHDYRAIYGLMVDGALRRPATAVMTVEAERAGSVMRFDVRLTNKSGDTLSASNEATLTALIWEEPASASEVPIVSHADSTAITTLADGSTGEYSLEAAVSGLNANRIRWVVIADYQPIGETNPFDTLQAVAGP